MKWPPDPAHLNENNGNDFTYFRLAEMYLIKAEAGLNGATVNQTPLVLVNLLRARVFNPDQPVTAVTADTLLRERLFELTAEAKRRQDLIRFGQYTTRVDGAPLLGGKVLSDPFRILFPIPSTQLDANPLLVQNAGY
jgi:hypothetical protein